MFHRNVGWLSTDYMALYPRRQYSSRHKLFAKRHRFSPRHSFSYICKCFLKFKKAVRVVFVKESFTANQANLNRVMLLDTDNLHLFLRRRHFSVIPFRNEPCLSWFHCKSCGLKSGSLSGQTSFKIILSSKTTCSTTMETRAMSCLK
jgi:hypothetical protein